MSGLQCLASENIWFDKQRYDEAERRFYEGVNGPSRQQQQVETSTHSLNSCCPNSQWPLRLSSDYIIEQLFAGELNHSV